MYNLPTPTDEEVTDLTTYIIDEQFISVSSYELTDGRTTLTFNCTLTKRRYVMDSVTIYFLWSNVITNGYENLIVDMADALSYFDQYDTDYLETVLNKMEVITHDEKLIEHVDKYKLLCYLYRIHRDKDYVLDFIADLELYLLS
jgi:hypothetical protein